MTDVKQLIYSTVEIEGLLKILLERPDEYASGRLRNRFDAYVRDMTEFLSEPGAGDEKVTEDLKKIEGLKDLDPEKEPAAAPVPAAARPSLRSAFTLNDKFFFLRNVFGGNEDDFNNTIDILDGMDSYDEAEDYIIADMMLDANAPEVRQFLDFLSAHMNP